MDSAATSPAARVLVVDDDRDIAQLVEDCLVDEGYAVDVLKDARLEAIQEAVERHQPDCILLDGGAGSGYGDSWDSAAWMSVRTPPIPTIMFTAHQGAVAEATANESERSKAAGLVAVLGKPFDLGHLLSAVEDAVRRSRHPAQR